MISFTIPMIPESVNHYTQHSAGRHFKNERARAWEKTFPSFTRGQTIKGDTFAVTLRFVLGPKQHPDIDNLPKQVLDSLARAGVLLSRKGIPVSDNKVKRLSVEVVDDDRKNCRTEITVNAMWDGPVQPKELDRAGDCKNCSYGTAGQPDCCDFQCITRKRDK